MASLWGDWEEEIETVVGSRYGKLIWFWGWLNHKFCAYFLYFNKKNYFRPPIKENNFYFFLLIYL